MLKDRLYSNEKRNDPEFKRKEAERKRNKRRGTKLLPATYEAAKDKDRTRKRNKPNDR